MEVAVKARVKRRHLNAAECDELGQCAEGASSLTLPHTFNHGHRVRDPNRGLYPRTPTKRWKPASASPSESPSGKQKAINDFFSVKGVIRTSPQKPFTDPNGLNGELLPKQEPAFLNNEEDDFDDDDDVSLLAAALPLEATVAKEEEEGYDDASFLEVPMETKQEPVLDYLEGMTAEMFGDDEDFDCCDEDIHKEEEEGDVEALPDTHYGLLGNKKNLLEPQGCIDDLPEEVLIQVLCHVPAQDLYRNISRVCHRWRNIVQDPKFVPFKKQFYRYTMWETTTVESVFCTLRSSHIIGMPTSDESVRQLVVLMAQHTVGERVRPEDVLERVKTHRLYPQSEASIRLRIPDIHRRFNLGLVKGPNPYAVMAIILILSENVDDVRALVSRLHGCMSHTAITEYLCHMAMMLLALERNKIEISNRLHYNIYYVLHLMENGPFPDLSVQTREPQIHLTHEQQQILSHDIQPDHVVKIVAFAGTGKTSTLVKYAEQRPHLRFLYVAFNKSVASEAQRRFPRNVDCKTVHSLAFSDVGRRYRPKLTSNLKPFTLSPVLPEGRKGFKKAKIVLTTLENFLASTNRTILLNHVPTFHISKGAQEMIPEAERPLFLQDAQMIWSKMKDLHERSNEAYRMTHDGYLKLWQLRVPKPRLSDKYDAIFIDEAQDCTPAILDVMLSQSCGKILVGDPHQQIYTFRGAVNALNKVVHSHIYYLTQSFRFGAEIAYVGATILKVCKKVQKILVGGKQEGGVCDEAADRVEEAMTKGVSLCPGKTAILARCNVSVFSTAVKLTDANQSCRIHFVGGVEGVGLNRILDIWRLMQKTEDGKQPAQKTGFIRDSFIRCFAKNKSPFTALKNYATQTEDRELDTKLSIVEKYRDRIPELVSRLESCFESEFSNADFIVGTVHKAKGLEFETVIVLDDFAKVPCSRHNLDLNVKFSFRAIHSDEWNLLYVAVTRAKTTLLITKTVRHILSIAGEYFLTSMPNSSLGAGDPIPCTIPHCPNCTTPGSAFGMCKKEMKCTDGVSAGGPLCERCVWTRIGPTAFLMTDDVRSMAEIPRHLRSANMFIMPY